MWLDGRILVSLIALGQRAEDQLEDPGGRRCDRSHRAAPDSSQPCDVGPRLDDRHAVALPPRNSSLLEEPFHASVLGRPERHHAITGTPPSDNERPGELVGVEGDTPRVWRDGAGIGGT